MAGETLAKAVYIHNKADLPIYFEFVTDPLGVFAFDRVRGSVGGLSSTHVTVTFQPKEASNFWKQVTCLIRVSGYCRLAAQGKRDLLIQAVHGVCNFVGSSLLEPSGLMISKLLQFV